MGEFSENRPRSHLETQVDIQARKLYFEVFIWFRGSWSKISENGERGFTQGSDARLVSILVWPGEPPWKTCVPVYMFPKLRCHFLKNNKNMVPAPNVPKGPTGHDYKIYSDGNGLKARKFFLIK